MTKPASVIMKGQKIANLYTFLEAKLEGEMQALPWQNLIKMIYSLVTHVPFS